MDTHEDLWEKSHSTIGPDTAYGGFDYQGESCRFSFDPDSWTLRIIHPLLDSLVRLDSEEDYGTMNLLYDALNYKNDDRVQELVEGILADQLKKQSL